MKNPDKNNIHDLFDGTVRYAAPVFQRYYVWEEEQLEALLEDIENASKDGIQFIGAIVVQDFGKKAGVQSPTEYLMIDGQQRLTTIYLLLSGVAWCYLSAKRRPDASTLTLMYLASAAGSYRGVPKILPTAQDRKQFYSLLRRDLNCIAWNFEDSPADETSRKTALNEQWERIKHYLEGRFFDAKNRLLLKRLEEFKEKILGYIELVQITLEPRDDANAVFSRLNFDGVRLSTADLVRNDVFSRFKPHQQSAAKKFYDEKWAVFEKSFPKNSFEQYVSIYAQIKFKGNCPKSKAFPMLQESWKSKGALAILNELETYTGIYSSLIDFKPIVEFDKQVNEQVRRFSYMPKTTVTWPYIVQVLHAFKNSETSKKQTLESLHMVESFLVRRAINGLEPTGLHAVFKSLWNRAGADKKSLVDKITTSTIKCPGDSDLYRTIMSENMYKRQIIKYLLIQREVSHNKLHGYDNATEDFSAEHVMPRNYSGQWKTLVTKEEHDALVNLIGNLVPSTTEQNSKVKDGSWEAKKKILAGSNWKTTQQACLTKRWDKREIQRRSKDFYTWAINEWPELHKI
jgi:hypothetical protein